MAYVIMKNDVTRKFDIEFVRALLQEIEASDVGEVYYTDDVRKCYHLEKMIEGGLIEGYSEPDPVDDGWSAEIRDITYKGHEFLHATSGTAVWSRVKQVAFEKGVGLTVDYAFKIAMACF